MLTQGDPGRSSQSGEGVVVKSQLLLSAASVTTLGLATATTASTATATSAAASAVSAVSLDVDLVFLTLEMKEVGELGLADCNVVDFLILKVVYKGYNLLGLGGSSEGELVLVGLLLFVDDGLSLCLCRFRLFCQEGGKLLWACQ
ncbi:hypothetical protein FGO68_gene12218 [Halteria grandinella]|uniref:Uncharacterized protein n=1 Tax=Halteria grandinella TaxID=5974 RepID=A0A8J8SXZ9_HALGN|nr:hypothetical protein FGO68_gene12218 [Halteria grandinella]